MMIIKGKRKKIGEKPPTAAPLLHLETHIKSPETEPRATL
jgi:hypothetical protein